MAKIPLNIPNILTFLRLLMIAPAVITALNGQYLAALVIFLAACITDLLDGYIARKYKMISNAGIILDPLADKLMAVSMTIVFTINAVYPIWVSVIILVKELMMVVGGFILLTKKLVLPSNKFGKAAAFSFNFALALAFLNQYASPYYLWVMYLSLGLMVAALIQYAYLNWYKKYICAKRAKQGL